MANIFDRLQFVRGLNPHSENGVFDNREDAYNYVINQNAFGGHPTLLAEPMVLLYQNNDDEYAGPNVILAIGSVSSDDDLSKGRTFFIDTKKTEEEIEAIEEQIEEIFRILNFITPESDTMKMFTERTDNGTILSGDVKVADYRITSGRVENNIIQIEPNKGLYAFVDMDYDPNTFLLKFKVNGATKEFQLPVDQHLVKGWYDPTQESIIYKLADGTEVKVLVTKLINEWRVIGEATDTPIMLFREPVSAETEGHEGIYNWQDILRADVRVANQFDDNILQKDPTGKYLYVKGTADNIKYKNGQTVKEAIEELGSNVSTSVGNLIYKRPDGLYAYAMLDYNSAENKLIYKYSDGPTGEFKQLDFTLNSVKILEDITYDSTREVIVIRYIDAKGEYQRVEIPVADIIEEWAVNNEGHNVQLNKYRSVGQGKDVLTADVKLYVGENNILEDKNHMLYVNGVADNIKYSASNNVTVRNVLDSLSAKTGTVEGKLDEEIERAKAVENEIKNTIGSGFTSDPHENITTKFNELDEKVDSEIARATNKETELEGDIANEVTRASEAETALQESISEEGRRASDAETALQTAINGEITRATDAENAIQLALTEESLRAVAKETELNNKIGSGFTTDIHETVTYKFDELSNKVDSEASKLQTEIERSTAKDTELEGVTEALNAEIGDGFGPRNTVRDEIDKLQGEIDIISGDSSTSIKDVINNDKSINIDKTDATKPVISVNLSNEGTGDSSNIIKLNADGLFVNVDISYDENSNKLTLHRSGINEDKVIQLESMSSIINIEYNASKEAIVITYMTNGHEVRTIEIPVRDLISEWDVDRNTDGAIKLTKTNSQSGTTDKDILSAEVIISAHEDNILSNDNGSLYVSGRDIMANAAAIDAEVTRATAAENTLSSSIAAEETRATEAENALQTGIDNEVTRATSAESSLFTDINAEVVRANSAETALQTAIDNEVTRAESEEARIEHLIADEATARENSVTILSNSISTEVTRATGAESVLQTAIDNEATRATGKEAELDGKIATEAAERASGDTELRNLINASKLTFNDTTTVDLTEANNVVEAVVKLQEGNNIIKAGQGLYATVDLSYESLTNKLTLTTTAGEKEIQLVGMSVLESISYDSENKELIIVYKDGTGQEHTVQCNVTDLFNEWDVQNQTSGSAIHLEKVAAATETGVDLLKANVILTNLDDNMLSIVGNGLYVSSAPIDAVTGNVASISGAVEELREEVEGALGTENTATLNLYRNSSNNLLGDVKISSSADNLLKLDAVNGGLIVDVTSLDLGEY